MDSQTIDTPYAEEGSSRTAGRTPSLKGFMFGTVCDAAGMISNRASELARWLGSIESWAGSRRRTAISAVPDPAGTRWEIPATAYLLTAAVADGDHARAAALWKPLDKPAQADMLWVLAAQLQCDLRAAISFAAGAGGDRYALAMVLAGVSVEISTARHIGADVFAETCRSIAGREAR